MATVGAEVPAMRRLLSLLFALGCAVLGAAAGRAIVRWREESAAGREPSFDLEGLQPTPREVIPGLVAALRVHDQPWSSLHIPSWLAAFVVNAALGGLSKELAPLLRMFGMDAAEEAEPPMASTRSEADMARASGIVTSEVWTAERLPSTPQPPSAPASSFRPFGT
jgi:hypothetical protein